jgi:hypothetical protein
MVKLWNKKFSNEEAQFVFKITAAQREFFNFRYDRASFECEMKKLHLLSATQERDFRSRREREEDERLRASQSASEQVEQSLQPEQESTEIVA